MTEQNRLSKDLDKLAKIPVGRMVEQKPLAEHELREKIREEVRQFFWWSRQHPQKGESVNLEELTGGVADEIHALYKEAGYVKLADDQTLPARMVGVTTDIETLLNNREQELLRKGWRKVSPPE